MIYPKTKTYRCQRYLDFLKTRPCVKCGAVATEYLDIVPAHQGFGQGWGAMKSHDIWALPLCKTCHTDATNSEHNGVQTFWKNINRELECLKLIAMYLSSNKGRKI